MCNEEMKIWELATMDKKKLMLLFKKKLEKNNYQFKIPKFKHIQKCKSAM